MSKSKIKRVWWCTCITKALNDWNLIQSNDWILECCDPMDPEKYLPGCPQWKMDTLRKMRE